LLRLVADAESDLEGDSPTLGGPEAGPVEVESEAPVAAPERIVSMPALPSFDGWEAPWEPSVAPSIDLTTDSERLPSGEAARRSPAALVRRSQLARVLSVLGLVLIVAAAFTLIL
jgi:hypothetical protein